MPPISNQEKKFLRRRSTQELIKDISNLGFMMENAIEQKFALQVTEEDCNLVLFSSSNAISAILVELHERKEVTLTEADLQLCEVQIVTEVQLRVFIDMIDRIEVKKTTEGKNTPPGTNGVRK